MRWRKGRRSSNIEDRRGRGGRGGRVVRRAGGVSIVGLLIAIGASMLFGIDPRLILSGMGGGPAIEAPAPRGGAPYQGSPAEQELAQFVSVVLADTEDTWNKLFQQAGQRYSEPKLVLFSSQVNSACGFASAASGPFYCPGDRKVYLDLNFFDELKRRFGAPGDFAQAYVIAHEVRHQCTNIARH